LGCREHHLIRGKECGELQSASHCLWPDNRLRTPDNQCPTLKPFHLFARTQDRVARPEGLRLDHEGHIFESRIFFYQCSYLGLRLGRNDHNRLAGLAEFDANVSQYMKDRGCTQNCREGFGYGLPRRARASTSARRHNHGPHFPGQFLSTNAVEQRVHAGAISCRLGP
jgi:hypothetical protein